MREILFRGKRINDGEWLCGYLIRSSTGVPYMAVLHDHIPDIVNIYEIAPETVGQYTGLKDKKGTKVFTGDIFDGMLENSYIAYCDNCKTLQLFNCLGECMECSGDIPWYDTIDWVEQVSVVGNVFDNPELLEEW